MREGLPPPTCHLLHVMYHVSHVMYHVSHVMCQVSCVTCNMNFFLQCGEASYWRVCYQRDLPCLVFTSVALFWVLLVPNLGILGAGRGPKH